jgi:hypothetical protein
VEWDFGRVRGALSARRPIAVVDRRHGTPRTAPVLDLYLMMLVSVALLAVLMLRIPRRRESD